MTFDCQIIFCDHDCHNNKRMITKDLNTECYVEFNLIKKQQPQTGARGFVMFIFAPNVNLGDQRQAPPLSENLGYYANVPPQAPQASHHHLSYS